MKKSVLFFSLSSFLIVSGQSFSYGGSAGDYGESSGSDFSHGPQSDPYGHVDDSNRGRNKPSDYSYSESDSSYSSSSSHDCGTSVLCASFRNATEKMGY